MVYILSCYLAYYTTFLVNFAQKRQPVCQIFNPSIEIVIHLVIVNYDRWPSLRFHFVKARHILSYKFLYGHVPHCAIRLPGPAPSPDNKGSAVLNAGKIVPNARLRSFW